MLVLVWNIPDAGRQWVKELLAITHPGQDPLSAVEPLVIAGFGPAEPVRTPWRQVLAPAEVVELVSTWSRINTSPPAQRDALLDAVRDVVLTHPELAGATEVEFPYVCVAYRYRAA